jgi:serine/threonine-protein kinase RIO1
VFPGPYVRSRERVSVMEQEAKQEGWASPELAEMLDVALAIKLGRQVADEIRKMAAEGEQRALVIVRHAGEFADAVRDKLKEE